MEMTDPIDFMLITVAGLTMTKADRQSLQAPHSHSHRSRSADVSSGRFTERRSTPSWCRSARFSRWRVARDLGGRVTVILQISPAEMPASNTGVRLPWIRFHNVRLAHSKSRTTVLSTALGTFLML